MVKAYLVVRIKGQADVPYWADTTLRLLKLEKKYRATIVPAKENTLGMLDKIKHYVSWQEVNQDMAKELLHKKGRKSGYKKISDADFGETEYKTIDGVAIALAEGQTTLTKIKTLKPWFALSPPRHGFKKSTKRTFGEHGILGPNKELDTLVRNMI